MNKFQRVLLFNVFIGMLFLCLGATSNNEFYISQWPEGNKIVVGIQVNALGRGPLTYRGNQILSITVYFNNLKIPLDLNSFGSFDIQDIICVVESHGRSAYISMGAFDSKKDFIMRINTTGAVRYFSGH